MEEEGLKKNFFFFGFGLLTLPIAFALARLTVGPLKAFKQVKMKVNDE
jgi:hypothetical protein